MSSLQRSARLTLTAAIVAALLLSARAPVAAQHTQQDGPAVTPTSVSLATGCPTGTRTIDFTEAEVQDGVTGTNKYVNMLDGDVQAEPYPHRAEVRVWRDPLNDENDDDPDATEPANGIRFDLDAPADGTYDVESAEVHIRGASAANRYDYSAFSGGGTKHDDELIAPGGTGGDGAPYVNGVRVCIFVVVPDFVDIDTTIYKSDIVWLASAGITSGCATSPPKFCPTSNVTRGQMAAFLVRALELPFTSNDYFTDDDGISFEASINALAASRITFGCTATTFCPTASVTRAQMAAFLVRALHLPPTDVDYFDDDDGMTLEASINALAASGITHGCAANKFCPTSPVTRGQMAAFLRRALK